MSIPNYTEAQVKALRGSGKIDLQAAKQFAQDWGKSPKSIIAKAVSMGVYTAQARPLKGAAKPRKADIVAAIAKATQADGLDGLEKAPAVALSNLLMAIK